MATWDNEPYAAYEGEVRPIFIDRLHSGVVLVDFERPAGIFFVPSESAETLMEFLESATQPKTYRFKNPTHSLADLGICDAPNITERELNAWVHIVNSCNLSCNYCYIPKLNKAARFPKAETFMTQEVSRATILGMFRTAQERNFNLVSLRFAGGEPSLALAQLTSACDYAIMLSKEFGIRAQFSAISNGTDVSEEFIDFARQYNFSISFSLDGFKEDHDKSRFQIFSENGINKRQGTWEKVFESFEKCRLAKVPAFALTTVTKENLGHLDQMVRQLVGKDIGFRLSLVRDKVTAFDAMTQEAFSRKLIDIYAELPEILPLDRPIPSYANFAEWNPSFPKKTACGTCNNSFAVSETGSVASCQMRLNRSFGYVQDTGLQEILSGMRASPETWRFSRPDEGIGGCTRCSYRYICAGGCPEHTYLAASDYDRPSPWCRVYGALLPHYVRAVGRQIERAWSGQNRNGENSLR
jgi:uncharacterized protein